MFGTQRHKVLTLLSIASSILIVGCSSPETKEVTPKESWHEIRGNTQGTTYGIILNDPARKIKREAIDSILHDFDMALSTYIDSSLISRINQALDFEKVHDANAYLRSCWNYSTEVFQQTNGAFDPTVSPLVAAWGFYGDSLKVPSAKELEEILNRVGFEQGSKYTMAFNEKNELTFFKTPGLSFDFNAIAQGYAVDVLADYLDENGIKNYYVEIGGEIVVKGKNRENVDWRLGIDVPKFDGQREVENVVNLTDRAIATSGNYRKYYEKDGVKYAHTINPKTGKPVQHSLLSATVVSETCAFADAYATAFMVMGVEETMNFIKKHPELNLDVYLLYDDGSGTIQRAMTDSFKEYLE